MTTIVVIGPPGAGKGTRIAKVKEILPEMVTISTGNLLRANNIDTSSGKLISDDVVIELLMKELATIEKDKIVLLDGVPRTLEQARMMKEAGIKIDGVIYLPISEEEAIERAEDRMVCSKCQAVYTKSEFNPPKKEGICDICESELTKRSDDNRETVLERLSVYREKTYPLIPYFSEEEGIIVITIGTKVDNDSFLKAIEF